MSMALRAVGLEAVSGGPEYRGSGNPEQLFAAGYAACFHSVMRFAVQDLGLPADALADARRVAQRVKAAGKTAQIGG
jgi:organic hydroperoxide reductase OsmC/OhrA